MQNYEFYENDKIRQNDFVRFVNKNVSSKLGYGLFVEVKGENMILKIMGNELFLS